jgi:EmrB/QacA subfamily drug resistance transporter
MSGVTSKRRLWPARASVTVPRWQRPSPGVAVAVVYVAAMFMSAVDMQIVNVALPTLSHQFSAPLSGVQWTVISYLLALAVLIPTSGWVADRVGVKETFLLALLLFTAASALCGLVGSLGELIGARALQGAGGGMLMPAGTSMLYRTFPAERRARIARTLILPVLIGPGIAPILGGVLTQSISWRWVFLINVPVGVATLIFGWRLLPRFDRAPYRPLDLWGVVLSGAGLSGLLYAISEGSALGWGSVPVLVCGVGGVVLLAWFTSRSLRQAQPLLRVRLLLENRLFRSTNIVFALCTGSFLGSLYLTPIFLQQALHQSPISSGATTFVEAIGVGVGAQTLARLYPRFGPRVLASAGACMLVVYLALFVLIEPGTNLWLVRALMLFGGFGNSAAFLAVQTAMFTTIGRSDIGDASAIYNTQRQSTIALNVAILTTIVASSTVGSVSAFHTAYLVDAALAVCGLVCAVVLIRTRDAHATMQIR